MKRKIHLLSITREICQKCEQANPWTYRLRFEDLISGKSTKDEIRCKHCVHAETLKADTVLYDHLRRCALSPHDILKE